MTTACSPHLKLWPALILGLCLTIQSVLSQEAVNLLKNTDFLEGKDGRISSWVFTSSIVRSDPNVAEHLEWKAVETPADGRCLAILSKGELRTNVWWQQDVSATGGLSYEAKVDVKGLLKKGGGVLRVGFYFFDASNKFFGYQVIQPPVEFSGDWQTVKGRVVAPENAARIGIRVGPTFDGEVEVFLKNPVLSQVLE